MEQTSCSVVVPVEGDLDAVDDTLCSLFDQMAQPQEVLLVASGLDEECGEKVLALQREHPALAVVRQQRPGLITALNAGLALTRGTYVSWLLPGCRLDSGALAGLSEALEKQPEIGAVFARCAHRQPPAKPSDQPEKGWAERLLEGNPVGCAFLMRAECARALGALRDDIPGLEAWDWWLRVSEEFGIGELQESLCVCGAGCPVSCELEVESAAARALVAAHRRRRRRNGDEPPTDRGEVSEPPPVSTGGERPGPKVLLLAPELPPALGFAVGHHLLGLSRALAEKGCQVHVLAPDGRPAALRGREPIWVHSPRQRPPFRGPNLVADVLQEQALLLSAALEAHDAFGPFDLIHAHGWTGASLAHSLREALAAPLVFTLHRLEGLEAEDQADQLYARELTAWVCEEARRVICFSQFAADWVRRHYAVPAEKIAIIPLPVDTRDWETDADLAAFRELAGPPESRVVTFAGRLAEHKGPQVLMEALPSVLAVLPEARLVVAGEGPMEAYLRRRVRELGLDQAVTLTGYLKGKVLATLLWASDLYVMSSLTEASGQGAAEAMVCGVPVVASAAGGTPELIAHEENGLLVPPGDAKALAIAVVRALYDRHLAQRIGEEGQARVLASNLWRDAAADVLHVYTQVQPEFARLS